MQSARIDDKIQGNRKPTCHRYPISALPRCKYLQKRLFFLCDSFPFFSFFLAALRDNDLYLCDFLGVVRAGLEDLDLLVDVGGVHPLGPAHALGRVLRVGAQQGAKGTEKEKMGENEQKSRSSKKQSAKSSYGSSTGSKGFFTQVLPYLCAPFPVPTFLLSYPTLISRLIPLDKLKGSGAAEKASLLQTFSDFFSKKKANEQK